MRRLLDHDPLTGVWTYHHYDDVTKRTTIETVQDVQPFLDANRSLYNEDEYSRAGKKAEWWHVATIPVGVQEKWMRELGVNIYDRNHTGKIKRLLNSPDWRYLRTAAGHL